MVGAFSLCSYFTDPCLRGHLKRAIGCGSNSAVTGTVTDSSWRDAEDPLCLLVAVGVGVCCFCCCCVTAAVAGSPTEAAQVGYIWLYCVLHPCCRRRKNSRSSSSCSVYNCFARLSGCAAHVLQCTRVVSRIVACCSVCPPGWLSRRPFFHSISSLILLLLMLTSRSS